MKAAALKPREAAAVVRAVYAALESRPLHRGCVRRTECCQFKLTGKTPHLTSGEALLAAAALRSTGRTRLPVPRDGACPLLDERDGRCLIYQDRPFACRTHFCAAAGGPYARGEVVDLVHRLEDLDRALGGAGARPITAALDAALLHSRRA